jgi:FlaA1/EpsC-like NDP-sugar epimerase
MKEQGVPATRTRAILGPIARNIVTGAVGLVILVGAYYLAFLLRFDLDIAQMPDAQARNLLASLPVAVLAKAAAIRVFNLHRGSWRYAGLRDVESTLYACAAATAMVLALNTLVLDLRNFPRSVYALDLLLSAGLLAGLRLGLRMVSERRGFTIRTGKRLIIVGGGDTGELLLRQLGRSAALQFRPVGIVDDDPQKKGLLLHGVPILSSVERLSETAEATDAEEIIIAAPSATGDQMRRMTDLCRATGLPFAIMPPTEEVLAGGVSWKALREVRIEDLLGRQPVHLDVASMADFLDDRVVLVTGAGGSIGSEICRQVAHWKPRLLVLVEQAENPLFHLLRDLRDRAPGVQTVAVVADISHAASMKRVMNTYHPAVVVHTAAHKHVPLMERNVPEAIKNNVFGTRCVAMAASEMGVETFLFVSTDKAVNPTSVMGTTKRVAELVLQDLGRRTPTRFVTVRFGNVLGSAGSVVPIFKQQIARGGPVTVTHKDMVRFFMTIPEAARLVLQAAALEAEGNLFLLDMGDPVRIVDLAEDLIRLSGLEPHVDIQIRFTGIRPGEKLYEELLLGDEGLSNPHDKIHAGAVRMPPEEMIRRGLERLQEAMASGDEVACRSVLADLVPESKLRTRGTDTGRTKIVSAQRT